MRTFYDNVTEINGRVIIECIEYNENFIIKEDYCYLNEFLKIFLGYIMQGVNIGNPFRKWNAYDNLIKWDEWCIMKILQNKGTYDKLIAAQLFEGCSKDNERIKATEFIH